jgi:hypothetical protein
LFHDSVENVVMETCNYIIHYTLRDF